MTVTNEIKAKICKVLRKHITSAANDIAEKDLIDIYWPEGYAERLAEQVAQTMCFASESAKGE